MQHRTLFAGLVLALSACNGGEADIELPETLYNYANVELPEHFTQNAGQPNQGAPMDWDNTPEHNPITDEGATLGRVLFYDTNLSFNNTVSCASCHEQSKGFSDDEVLSVGFEGGRTGRHSMGLANARFYGEGRFFWDQRAETLEDQVLMPFQDQVEMGMTLDLVEERVREDDRYEPLFVAAFGDDEVSSDRVSLALAQFVRSMVSTNSRYDQARAEVASRFVSFPAFTEQENLGRTLFVQPPPRGGLGCFFCHGGDAQIAFEASSNGLDREVTDEGYGEVTGLPRDQATFKVPSLRNIGVRAPYMHDGRFETLEAVVEHYSTGVQPHSSLPPFFQVSGGDVVQMNLTTVEKEALVAFLHTLTDDDFLTDPKFSDPFVQE